MINAKTNKEYSLSNTAQLEEAAMINGYESGEVAGYAQWQELGRQVMKGQKCTYIKMICEKSLTHNGVESKKKVMKTLKVFFKEQTEEVSKEQEQAA